VEAVQLSQALWSLKISAHAFLELEPTGMIFLGSTDMDYLANAYRLHY